MPLFALLAVASVAACAGAEVVPPPPLADVDPAAARAPAGAAELWDTVLAGDMVDFAAVRRRYLYETDLADAPDTRLKIRDMILLIGVSEPTATLGPALEFLSVRYADVALWAVAADAAMRSEHGSAHIFLAIMRGLATSMSSGGHDGGSMERAIKVVSSEEPLFVLTTYRVLQTERQTVRMDDGRRFDVLHTRRISGGEGPVWWFDVSALPDPDLPRDATSRRRRARR